MKIGIDTFGCDHARSGFGSYLTSFISNIPSDTEFEFELFGSELDRYTYSSDNSFKFNSVSFLDSLFTERIWHIFGIKKFCHKSGYDVVIYPAVERVLPLRYKTKGVAVVNSLISKNIDNYKGFYKWHLKKGLLHASKIIASSNVIKEDLIDIGIPESKIQVIYNGIDHKLFYPMVDLDEQIVRIEPFSIKRPYFVYGSRLSGPEKKHEELIKAFDLFKKRTGLPHRLVLAGSEGAFTENVHKIAFESEYSSDIFITGYFPHENFAKLYAGADACVFPATNEGVGLPILEAMACGIPVICSDSGALKEVGGDVPLYFNSDNPDEIAASMQRVVEDSELRSKMIQEGLVWSNKFQWENTIDQTLECIKKL